MLDGPVPATRDHATPDSSTQNIFSEVYHKTVDAVTKHPTFMIAPALAAGGTIAAAYFTHGEALAGMAEEALGAEAGGALAPTGESVLSEATLGKKLAQDDLAMYTHQLPDGHIQFAEKPQLSTLPDRSDPVWDNNKKYHQEVFPSRVQSARSSPPEINSDWFKWLAPDPEFAVSGTADRPYSLATTLKEIVSGKPPESMVVSPFQGRTYMEELGAKSLGKYSPPQLEGGLTGLKLYHESSNPLTRAMKAMIDRGGPKGLVDSADSLNTPENAVRRQLGLTEALPDSPFPQRVAGATDPGQQNSIFDHHQSWHHYEKSVQIGNSFSPPLDIEVWEHSPWATLFKGARKPDGMRLVGDNIAQDIAPRMRGMQFSDW